MNSEHREIRLSGSGGQGLALAGRILAEALLREGKQIAQSSSYEPTSRGGLSRADLVVDTGELYYPLVVRLDLVVILDPVAVNLPPELLAPQALIVVDQEIETPSWKNCQLLSLPLLQTARTVGNPRVTNIVALGALNQASKTVGPNTLQMVIRERVPSKFLQLNLEAFGAGVALVADAPETAPATPTVSQAAAPAVVN